VPNVPQVENLRYGCAASSTGFQPVPGVPQVNNLRYGCAVSSTGFQSVPNVPQVDNLRYEEWFTGSKPARHDHRV
jgi:hypothetical protein